MGLYSDLWRIIVKKLSISNYFDLFLVRKSNATLKFSNFWTSFFCLFWPLALIQQARIAIKKAQRHTSGAGLFVSARTSAPMACALWLEQASNALELLDQGYDFLKNGLLFGEVLRVERTHLGQHSV